MSDDLAQQLIKAQDDVRKAQNAVAVANLEMRRAVQKSYDIQVHITKRAFEAVGIRWGATVITHKDRPGVEMLAVGVQGGTLMVRRQTRTGKWFKNAEPQHRVSALDIVIVRHEEGSK